MMKYFINHYLLSISILLLFTLGSVGCMTTPSQSELSSELNQAKQSIAALLGLAKTEEKNNQLSKAIFYYIQALELDKQNVEILYQIGDLQMRLHNPDLAIRAFEQVIAIVPEHILALAPMGIYYFERKNMDKARILLERTVLLDQLRLHNSNIVGGLVTLDQYSPLLAYNAYAVLNDLDSRHEYAREIFTLLLPIEEYTPMIYTNIGYSYYLTNSYILAQSYYQKALDTDANFKRAKLNLGLIYVRNGQYHRAVQLLKQVMTYAQAYNDIGYFLMLEGRYKEAEYFLQNAIELSPSYFSIGNINLENVHLYLNEKKFLTNEL